MAPAAVQMSYAEISKGRGARPPRKGGRATIKPFSVASVLLNIYLVFIYVIMGTFEDDTGRDSGAVLHLKAGSGAATGGAKNIDKQPGQHAPGGDDLVHFCGKCMWKDTLITCAERVAWEVDRGKSHTEEEAKRKNLIYCTKPRELHVSDYCGSCQWKDTEFTCDERVQYEVENNGMREIEAKRRNLKHCKRPPYMLSPLCGGCARALTNMTMGWLRVPCYDVMVRRFRGGKAASIVDAARIVAEEFGELCSRCHPERCWRHYFEETEMSVKGFGAKEIERGFRTKYWRFDQAAPKLELPTTLVLPSIPDDFRIPPSRFPDIEAFLTEKYHEFEANNDTTHVPIFMEYNPGLAPIPSGMKKYLPKYAAYAVALRVTPANNCFRRDQMHSLPQKVWDHTMMSATNLLGLALLDEDYEILPAYDVIVDIATQLELQRDGYGSTYFGEPTFMDYRLFTLNGAIYLHANSDTTVVTKLDLRMKRHSRKPKDGEFILDNVYGGNRLQVTLLSQFSAIWSGGERGKNFALFSVPNATHPEAPDSTYAEIRINPYHQVQQLYLDEVEMLERSFIKMRKIRRNYAVDRVMMRKVKENLNLTNSTMEPDPSFFTVDEHWFPGARPSFRRAGHGGACCVSFSRSEVAGQGEHIYLTRDNWGDNKYLFVGVAHTSVVWRRWHSDPNTPEADKAMLPHTHYLSFFYAFEPRPPFNLQARSGYFCLGFAGEDGEERGMFNPHNVLTVNRKLSQHNETFACPQIHFVSSFIEKVGDPSQTVIGYGLNDCTPRIVQVSKKEIARMVFSDPWEMKMERKTSDFDWDQSALLEPQELIRW